MQWEVGHEPIFFFGLVHGVSARVEDLQLLLEPAIAALGYELWGLELNVRPRHSLLRIYIDAPQGITVDDCALVSRQASAVLDVSDPIQGAFTLEVSSPGWDRPLFRASQYELYKGSRVKIRLARMIDGQRNLDGRIVGADEDGVELEVAAGARSKVPWGAIRKASLVIEDE